MSATHPSLRRLYRTGDFQRFDRSQKSKLHAHPPQYNAYLVEPSDSFSPTNWRDTPSKYRIVEFLGTKKNRGEADGWRFLHNRQQLESGSSLKWAVWQKVAGNCECSCAGC